MRASSPLLELKRAVKVGELRIQKWSLFQRESVQLLSRIPGVWTVGSLRPKKESHSTRREQRVGTGFGSFRQIP